jgi:hypothetical protein
MIYIYIYICVCVCVCVCVLSLKSPAHIDLHVQDIMLLDTDFQCSSDP